MLVRTVKRKVVLFGSFNFYTYIGFRKFFSFLVFILYFLARRLSLNQAFFYEYLFVLFGL